MSPISTTESIISPLCVSVCVYAWVDKCALDKKELKTCKECGIICRLSHPQTLSPCYITNPKTATFGGMSVSSQCPGWARVSRTLPHSALYPPTLMLSVEMENADVAEACWRGRGMPAWYCPLSLYKYITTRGKSQEGSILSRLIRSMLPRSPTASQSQPLLPSPPPLPPAMYLWLISGASSTSTLHSF